MGPKEMKNYRRQ